MAAIIKYLGILSLSCLVIACSSAAPQIAKYVSPVQTGGNGDAPPSVAIMPFDNQTSEDGIEILARKSFYNHFSSKNYRDIELTEIDHGLRILANNSSSSWREPALSSTRRYSTSGSTSTPASRTFDTVSTDSAPERRAGSCSWRPFRCS